MEERLCSKCGRNPRVPYQRWCAECRAQYNREYIATHREAIKAQRKRYLENRSPSEIERKRARDRQYHIDHREEIMAYQRKYREANREILLARQRERRAAKAALEEETNG